MRTEPLENFATQGTSDCERAAFTGGFFILLLKCGIIISYRLTYPRINKSMEKKPLPKHNFRDSVATRLKAQAASKGKKRPNRKSKADIVHEAKVEIVKEELLRQGYLKEVQLNLPKVMKAHFKVASNPRASATQERKLLFQSAGIMKEKEGGDVEKSIGQILAELARS